MKNIIKIKTDERHEQYYGTLINDHLINSGDPVIDWIDAQRYIEQNGLQDVEEHESVTYFSILSPWGLTDVEGLQTMIEYSMDKPIWTISEVQQYYKQKKQEFNTNPFNKFM